MSAVEPRRGWRGGDGVARNRREFLATAAGLTASVGLPSVLNACAGAPTGSIGPSDPIGGGGKPVDSATWAISGDIASLDYVYAFDFESLVVVPNVTESLFRLDLDGTPTPNLAAAHRWVDDRHLVLEIRQDVSFHDGSDMTVDDVVFSLRRHLDKDIGSYVGYFFDRVTDVRALNDRRVIISLSAADSRLLPALGTTGGAITQRAFVERHGADVGTPDVGILGTGPFKFESWTSGEQVVLERNESYWNESRPMQLRRLVVQILPEESTIISALRSNAVDGAFETAVSGQTLARLSDVEGLQIVRARGAGTRTIQLNLARQPFDDVRVRHALRLALDPAALLRATWGRLGTTVRSMSPSTLWTYDRARFESAYATYPKPKVDLRQARRLVSDAGAAGKTAEIWASTTVDRAQAVAVQEAAATIGLDLSVHSVSSADALAASYNQGSVAPYGLIFSPFVADLADPYGLLGFVYSTDGVFNSTGYSNRNVDRLLEASLTEPDPGRRAKVLIQAERLVYQDAPAIILYNPDAALIRNSRLGGYQLRALWSWDSWAADLSGS